jgi:hypothetical protein
MKGGVVETKTRPSRWDALRSNNDDARGSGSSVIANSAKDRRKLPYKTQTQRFSSNSSSTDDWRRSSSNRNISNQNPTTNKSSTPIISQTALSPQEIRIRKAIDKIGDAMKNDDDNCNSTISAAKVHNTTTGQQLLQECIAELNIAFFATSDPIFLKSPLHHHANGEDLDRNMPLSNVSDDMKWDAIYSQLQLFSQTSNHIRKQCNVQLFILCISRTASALLLSLSRHNGHRPNLMTDSRLGECVTIILFDILRCCGQGSNSDSTTNDCTTEDLLCKANIFKCIAELLKLSYVKGRGSLSSWGTEKAVTLIVEENALPFMEAVSTNETLTVSMRSTYCYGAMECIYSLLVGTNNANTMPQPKGFQVSKHAVAMLSATVAADVKSDGDENKQINPLRRKILRVVNSSWSWSSESMIQQQSTLQKTSRAEFDLSLQCMTAIFNTLHAFERGKAQKAQIQGNISEINVSAIARKIKDFLEVDGMSTFQPKLLRLLTALCMAYPISTANQWHLFLDVAGPAQPFLLSTMDKGISALKCNNFDNAALLPDALLTISSLISSIPFKNWIGGDGKSSRISGGNFACRVRSAIIRVMTSLTKLAISIKEIISEEDVCVDESLFELLMMHFALAVGNICTLLPFNDSNSVFTAPALTLVQVVADIFVMTARIMECERGNQSLLMKSMVQLSHVITSTDGIETVSVPVKLWLADASSYDFIGFLLIESSSAHSSPLFKCKLDTLTSVVKAAPWAVTREPFNLASFREICANLCKVENDTSRRLLGAKLIEAFILGRKAYVKEEMQHNMELAVVPESFCPLLLSALKDGSSAVRTAAVTSFGSLLVTDWTALLFRGTANEVNTTPPLDWTYVDSIINMCTPQGEKSGSVRSAACKALGDISNVCVGSLLSEDGSERAVLPFSDDFVIAISTKICDQMEHALKDQTVSVRCMALFAVGNTSLALKERCAFLPLHHMLHLVYACIADKDDKVVVNAIRTIGHVSYFVYTPEFLANKGERVSDLLKLYCSLLSNLTLKIQVVLCDATGEAPRELTWKQRNSTKKHAWGAATTIGMLLGHTHLLSHFEDSLVESALLQLFRCIQLHDFINEKIVAAAANALSTLPCSLWQYLSEMNCNSIAFGLATFVNFLDSNTSAQTTKPVSLHHADLERLAKVLILTAKKRDFCQLFILRENFPFSIDFFYQLLILYNVQSSTLQEVVEAITSQEMEHVIDVSDIQIFLSRANQHNQQVNDEDFQPPSDEEDEL